MNAYMDFLMYQRLSHFHYLDHLIDLIRSDTPLSSFFPVMTSHTYLITGANRGLGKGFIQRLLLRPDTTIIAATRNPEGASTVSLLSLPKAAGSRIVLVKIDSHVDEDPVRVAVELQSQHGIFHIDTVIACAGIYNHTGPASTGPLEELKEQIQVNAVAPFNLFRAVRPLLERSLHPKFVAISTTLASMSDMNQWPMQSAAYGSSKAMLNYLMIKVHHENDRLVAFVLNPGWVQTDMGNAGARAAGLSQAPISVEQSVNGMLSKVCYAT